MKFSMGVMMRLHIVLNVIKTQAADMVTSRERACFNGKTWKRCVQETCIEVKKDEFSKCMTVHGGVLMNSSYLQYIR